MSFQAKRELLAQTAARYQAASHAQRRQILDEFIAVTCYTRKYASRLLRHPPPVVAAISRPRPALRASGAGSLTGGGGGRRTASAASGWSRSSPNSSRPWSATGT